VVKKSGEKNYSFRMVLSGLIRVIITVGIIWVKVINPNEQIFSKITVSQLISTGAVVKK
jgi:hypothetical protein